MARQVRVLKKPKLVTLYDYQKVGIKTIDSGLKFKGRAILAD
jgi:hypothetical protein